MANFISTNQLFTLLLVVVLASPSLYAKTTDKNDLDIYAERKKIHKVLLNKTDAGVQIVELVKYFNRLIEISAEMKHPNDHEANNCKELLEMNEFKEDNCNEYHFVKFFKLDQKYKEYPFTFMHYIDYCRLQQFAICKDILGDKFKLYVEGLDDEVKQNMDELMNLILNGGSKNVERPKVPLNREDVAKGLLSYMEKMAGKPFDSQELFTTTEGSVVIKDEFKAMIDQVCGPILKKLKTPLISFIKAPISNIIDDYVFYWVLKGQICANIKTHMTDFLDDTYKVMMEKYKK